MGNIYIKYLGTFEISRDGETVITIKSSKNRVKKLLGMLLLEKRAQYTDSQLIERIWEEESIANTETALTNLVYLARKTLKALDDKAEFVIREDGKYIWNPKIKVDSDLEKIEEDYMKMIDGNVPSEIKLAFGLEIVALYDNELAASFDYDAWWLPVSEYYNKLFLNASAATCEILEKSENEDDHTKIIDIAANASRYDLGCDRFYIYIFKALKVLKRRKAIVEYYDTLSKAYFNKVGEPLCDEIKKIYAWATRSEEFTFDDLAALTESLRERSKDTVIRGAFYCDRDMFKNMVHFILRNSMRNDRDVVVMMITIYQLNETLTDDQLEKGMDKLEEIIRKSLRKDDIFSRYSTNQFLIMPFECKKDKINVIEKRINDNFDKANIDSDLAIDIINFTIEEDGYQLLY